MKTSKPRVTLWWPVNSPHKGPVTRKMCPFDDVIMFSSIFSPICSDYVCQLNVPSHHMNKCDVAKSVNWMYQAITWTNVTQQKSVNWMYQAITWTNVKQQNLSAECIKPSHEQMWSSKICELNVPSHHMNKCEAAKSVNWMYQAITWTNVKQQNLSTECTKPSHEQMWRSKICQLNVPSHHMNKCDAAKS